MNANWRQRRTLSFISGKPYARYKLNAIFRHGPYGNYHQGYFADDDEWFPPRYSRGVHRSYKSWTTDWARRFWTK